MSTLYHVLGLPQGATHEQVKAGLQFERFIEFVDLPTERIVGREQLTIDRHGAVRLPANTER